MTRRGENITKRRDGRWEARVIKGYRDDGKALYQYLYGKTYGEAKAKKQMAAYHLEWDLPAPQSDVSYGAVLSSFLTHQKNRVKESSYAHYYNMIERHIRPDLGNIPLSQLDSCAVETFAARKLQSGRMDRKGGLSGKTVRDLLSLIRLSLKYAESCGLISGNTISFCCPRNEPKRVQVLRVEEQNKMEAIASNSQEPGLFGVFLCLYTGLRIGELCALRWSDIDLESGLLRVNHTILRVKDTSFAGGNKTKVIITTPKTRCSRREIPLPSFLLTPLLQMKKNVESPGDSYFLTNSPRYIEPSNYFMKYKRWLKKWGLPDYSFHALRHTFATRCIECGFDPKSLSEILGHSSVNITLNRYVHPSLSLKRNNMEKLSPGQGPVLDQQE